jgi:NAD(P)-dependent dehydrogenase (short-subunit alcohol dehydrogenase family)
MDAAAGRRVAIVGNADLYAGPALARALAGRGHDLVLGDPADELVDELAAAGAAVEAVRGVADLSDPAAAPALVDAALARFGHIDAAVAWSKTGRGAYMPTPLVYDSILYVIANNGVFDAYDPAL